MATPLKIIVAAAENSNTLLLKRAFSRARLRAVLQFLRDGQELLNYLKLAPLPNGSLSVPDLLVLDLLLPRLSGYEVLEWLKQQPQLNRMLVLAFSDSGAAEEVARAYDLGADTVVMKPRDLESSMEVVHQIEQHWLRLNATPECGLENVWD